MSYAEKKKTKSDGSGYETYVKCESRDSAETLMTYASSDKNEFVLVELQDLTASEILAKDHMYHKSCYRNISREKKFPSREEAEECKLRNKCMDELRNFVELNVINQGKFMRLTFAANEYKKIQERAGLEPKGILVRNLKSWLQNAFGKKIDFFQKSAGLPEIMYGTENVKFQESSEQSDGSELVKQAAKLLREELLNSSDAYSSWPPTEKELLSAKYNTPPLTQTFMSHLLNSRGRSSTRSSRLISSMAQDLTYNASYGRKRVPKHIHLGVCVKRKSG